MQSKDKQILRKIITYCNEINTAIDFFGASYDVIASNNIFKNAVAMCVLQIGELSTKLTDGFKTKYSNLPWRDIRGMRNLLAHGYGTLDVEELWNTAMFDIPALQKYCKEILEEN